MAQRPSVVTAEVTSVPDPTEIARVAAFVREPFVEEGEDAAAVLAPGSVRRHAFEAALAELDAGADVPSQKWRRRWSLLLGLDRTLSATTPVLADGTTLNPHQIDALSGTYAALLADAQRRTSGTSGGDGDALLLSFEDEDPTELDEPAPADDDGPDDEGLPDDEPSPGEDGDGDGDGDGDDDDDLESLDEQLVELPDAEPESESSLYDDVDDEDVDEDIDRVALDDPNAHKRFWFEHATGAGKTVAAMGFVEACRTGGILILTHRRNLVDQFIDELRTRGYGERLSKPLLTDEDGRDLTGDGGEEILGPVTIETYQWFVRNAGRISGAYTVVICDEAHTALGDKTSAAIRAWTGPIFIGMTATGALIARHVADLFPTQTSRFDLAQAARRGVIAPLRCLRIPPGPGVRTIAKVPLRKGEVDMEFDQEELAKLLDQAPFNLAIADLYKTRFRNTPGVVYAAGVEHAYNVAESFRALGMKAQAVSGETPKRELASILAEYDAGEIDVLINAQLLAEGWNSPRATICMHLAPTASKRIYQQRVGRVTRRHPGKEAGVVIDFVHPATPNDDPVVTLHSLLDRDVYRGGAIVVGPVRRGRGRRVKVERRVLPVTPNIERRRQVFERELWRIAVEQLDWGEQRVWAALAGAKASPANWRRGRAMLNFDRSGELRRQFLITALERNRNQPLRMRAIQEIALLREAEPFDTAIDFIGQWPRDERREASRTLLQAMADRRIGRRDQATAWIWRLAEYTRDVHEEYAAQRWPATKHLLGLLVNSSGAAHARNARRLVHGARQHDRRLQAALLAAAVAHTPEAEEVLREARTRLARKPGALSRDLLKDFPNGKRRKKRSRKRRGANGAGDEETANVTVDGTTTDGDASATGAEDDGNGNGNGNGGGNGGNGGNGGGGSRSRRGRSRGGRRRNRGGGSHGGNAPDAATSAEDATSPADVTTPVDAAAPHDDAPADQTGDVPVAPQGESSVADRAEVTSAPSPATESGGPDPQEPVAAADAPPTRRRVRGRKAAAETTPPDTATSETSDDPASDVADPSASEAEATTTPRRTRTRTRKAAAATTSEDAETTADAAEPTPAPEATPVEKPAPRRSSSRKTAAPKAAEAEAVEAEADEAKTAAEAEANPGADDGPTKKPVARKTTARKTAAQKAAEAETADTPATADDAPKTTRRTSTRRTAAQKAAEADAADATAEANDAPAKKPTTRKTTARKAAAPKAAEADAADATPEADDTPAKKPATRKTSTRKTAAPKAAEADTDDATAEANDAPAKKPATRKTTAAKKTTTKTAAATKTAATTKTAAKKTAARKAAAPSAAADEAQVEKPATRRTATASASTTATKKPATRKATTRKATTRKTTASDAEGATAPAKPTTRRTTKATTAAAADPDAPKATTRRKAAPTPEEE